MHRWRTGLPPAVQLKEEMQELWLYLTHATGHTRSEFHHERSQQVRLLERLSDFSCIGEI